jgi:hypothetical protein
MYRTQAGRPDKNGWYLAESTSRHFKVKLPAPFNDFTVPGGNALVEISCVGTTTQDSTKWAATVGTYKDSAAAQNAFDEPFEEHLKVQIIRKFLFRGKPAKEMKIVNPKRSITTREILVGRDKYILMVDYETNNQTKMLQSSISTFMNSLEFAPLEPK